jgi:hypothetical protein
LPDGFAADIRREKSGLIFVCFDDSFNAETALSGRIRPVFVPKGSVGSDPGRGNEQ